MADAMDPTEELSIVSTVRKEFDELAAYRKPKEGKWREQERFYDGKHWQLSDDRPVINEVFKTIEYEVPILTDKMPGTDFVAVEEERQDDARVLKEAVDYTYTEQNIEMKVVKAVRAMLKSTNSYIYTDWDPDYDNGRGGVCHKLLSWPYVYLDPTTDEIDEMSKIHFRIPMQVDKLKRMYPNIADRIQAESIDYVDKDGSSMWLDEKRVHWGQKSSVYGSMFKPTDMAYNHEAWRKDYTMIPIPDEETQAEAQDEYNRVMAGQVVEVTRFQDHQKLIDILSSEVPNIETKIQQGSEILNRATMNQLPETADIAQLQVQADSVQSKMLQDLIAQHQAMLAKNPLGQKPMYPSFMRLTIIVSGVVAYDGPPDVDDGLYPIAPFYCYMEAGEPYGFGEAKNIIDQNKIIDELNFAEIENLRLNANSGWLVDERSGVDERTLHNKPGIVIKKVQGTEVQRIPPGQTSPQLMEKQQEQRASIQNISGITESVQGERPSSITAASAITALQNQGEVRIRLKERQIMWSMTRLGQLTASRIVKYWTSQRMLRLFDDSGRIKTVDFNPDRIQDLDYIVRASPGTTFGLTKESVYNIMNNLFQQGVIDAKTLIKTIDIPYKSSVMDYLEEHDQVQLAMSQLQAENDQLKQQLGMSGPEAGAMPQAPPNLQAVS